MYAMYHAYLEGAYHELIMNFREHVSKFFCTVLHVSKLTMYYNIRIIYSTTMEPPDNRDKQGCPVLRV